MSVTTILIALIVVAVLLLGIIITVIVKSRKVKPADEYDDEYDDDDYNTGDDEEEDTRSRRRRQVRYSDATIPLDVQEQTKKTKKQWKIILENQETWEKYTFIFYDNIGIGRGNKTPEFEKYITITDDPIQNQNIQIHIIDHLFCTGNTFFRNTDDKAVFETFEQLHRLISHCFIIAVVIGNAVAFGQSSVTAGQDSGSVIFGEQFCQIHYHRRFSASAHRKIPNIDDRSFKFRRFRNSPIIHYVSDACYEMITKGKRVEIPSFHRLQK